MGAARVFKSFQVIDAKEDNFSSAIQATDGSNQIVILNLDGQIVLAEYL